MNYFQKHKNLYKITRFTYSIDLIVFSFSSFTIAFSFSSLREENRSDFVTGSGIFNFWKNKNHTTNKLSGQIISSV